MKRIVVLLVLIVSLSSCYTKRQAARQVIRAQTVYPEIVANNCGLWYLPKEFTREQTRYIRGKDSVIRDTFTVDCTKPGNIGKKDIAVPCDQKTRVDTVIKEVVTQVENTAKVDGLNKTIARIQKEKIIYKTLCGICIGIIALFFISKFIK